MYCTFIIYYHKHIMYYDIYAFNCHIHNIFKQSTYFKQMIESLCFRLYIFYKIYTSRW